MTRKKGWSDQAIGRKTQPDKIELDIDDDEDMQALLDEIDSDLDEEITEEEPKPKKTAKKVTKKTKKAAPKKTTEDELDDLDLDDLDLDEKPEDEEPEPEDEEPEPEKVVKKKVVKKTRKKTKKKTAEDKLEEVLEEAKGTKKVEKTAEDIGVDLALECPVCRSLEGCDCTEEDRSFVRRVRFEEEVTKVARCPRDNSPLSVIYLARPGTKPPHDLSHFTAIWGCVTCRPIGLATVLASVSAKKS